MRYAKRRLYRSRRGIFFGVCQGLADWQGLSAGLVRILFILFFPITGGLIISCVYLGLAVFLPLEPWDGGGDGPPDGGSSGPGGEEEPEWKKRFFTR